MLRINGYNLWELKLDGNDSASRQDVLACLARRDSVVISENWTINEGLLPAELKTLDPSVKCYRHYSLLTTSWWDFWGPETDIFGCPISRHEIEANDWWLRDATGELVMSSACDRYLDVGKPGFKEAYAGGAAIRNLDLGFDGFSLDLWYPRIRWMAENANNGNRWPLMNYQSDEEWFEKAWQPFISHVMSMLRNAGWRVIGNSVVENWPEDSYAMWNRQHLDGANYEMWPVNWDGSWLDSETFNSRMNAFATDPLEAWIAAVGVNGADPLYRQKHLLALAMFYVAEHGKHASFNMTKNGKVYWEPLWDFELGSPYEPRQQYTDGGFTLHSRKYTQGLALVNYNPVEARVRLDSKVYTDPEGMRVYAYIQIPAYSGALLRCARRRDKDLLIRGVWVTLGGDIA